MLEAIILTTAWTCTQRSTAQLFFYTFTTSCAAFFASALDKFKTNFRNLGKKVWKLGTSSAGSGMDVLPRTEMPVTASKTMKEWKWQTLLFTELLADTFDRKNAKMLSHSNFPITLILWLMERMLENSLNSITTTSVSTVRTSIVYRISSIVNSMTYSIWTTIRVSASSWLQRS